MLVTVSRNFLVLIRESLSIKHEQNILKRALKMVCNKIFDEKDTFISIASWLLASLEYNSKFIVCTDC